MRRPVRPLLWLSVLFAALVWADEPLTSDAAVSLLYRGLSYDRSLNPTDGEVLLAIVTRKGQPPGEGEAFLAAASAAHGALVQGAKVRLVLLPVESLEELAVKLEEDQPHVIYVASGFEAEGARVVEVAQRTSVHCVYGAPGYAATLPLGVVSRGGVARVLVRLTAARRLGMVLDPQLLRLAIVQD